MLGDPAFVEQHASAWSSTPQLLEIVVRSLAPCCEQCVDQRDRHAAEPEPADREGGAVTDVGDRLLRRRKDLVHR